MAVPDQRPTVTFKTYVPGVNNPSFASGASSYLDLNYLSSSNPTAYTPGWHDSWCADREVTIIAGATYNNAKVYSTYEYAALRANPAFHATLGTYGIGLHLPSSLPSSRPAATSFGSSSRRPMQASPRRTRATTTGSIRITIAGSTASTGCSAATGRAKALPS